jgi:hypothetical protein
VQALPSLHVVPFEATGFEQVPVLGLHAPAVWHWSDAVHVIGFDPTQVPDWQESACVQALPSLQGVPFGAAVVEHAPVLGLHVPPAAHWPAAEHVTGFDPVHTPAWHASVCVQASPSVHEVPFAATGFEHTPVLGEQTPATWHASDAVQTTPVHKFPASSDPNPSWNVTVPPEFITTCAAASAPVNCDVSTVTRDFVARTSAWSFAPEFRLMPEDVSKDPRTIRCRSSRTP